MYTTSVVMTSKAEIDVTHTAFCLLAGLCCVPLTFKARIQFFLCIGSVPFVSLKSEMDMFIVVLSTYSPYSYNSI